MRHDPLTSLRGIAMAEREIILVRHAHAEPAASGQDDIARVLSLRGEAEADAAGAWLKSHGASPVRVLCSPAARAKETCERVLQAIGYADVRSEPRIYEATPGTLIRILDEHADASPLLLVGHNPGFENLVALLTEGASDSGRGIPPAGVVWLGVPAGSAIDPGTAAVHHFWWP
jgi:phosphohistidine phosphatase SixA